MRHILNFLQEFLEARPALLPVLILLTAVRLAILRPSLLIYLALLALCLLFWFCTRKFKSGIRLTFSLGFILLLLYFQVYRAYQTHLFYLGAPVEQGSYFINIHSVSRDFLKNEVKGVGSLATGEAKGLKLYFRGPLAAETEILPGQVFRVHAKPRRLTGSRVPGGFDSAAWLVKQGVFCQLTWSKASQVVLVSDRLYSYLLTRLAMGARAQLTEQLLSQTDRETGAVIAAMLYGDESYLAQDSEEQFQNFGLTHVLVASGTNVSLCLESLRPLTKKLFRKNEHRLPAEMIGLLFLAWLSLGQAAMLRASIMKMIELIHRRRKVRTLQDNYLYLSILIVAIVRPWLLLNTGFLMSSAATQAVYLQRKPDDLIPHATSAGRTLLTRLSAKMRLYLGIQLFLLPFLWEPGRYFSLAEIVANLFLLPLTELLLVWAFAFILFLPFAAVSHWLGLAISTLYHLFQNLLTSGAGLTEIGFTSSRLHLLFLLVVPYARLFPALQTSTHVKKVYLRERPQILVRAVLASCLVAGYLVFRFTSNGVYFLDAGQGDASLIWNGEKSILIDGGPPGFGRDLKSVLSYLEIPRLDYVFLSHLDQDHVAGVTELMEGGFPVGTIFLSRYGLEEEKLLALQDSAAGAGATFTYLEQGDQLTLAGIHFEILSPGGGGKESNDSSLVLLSNDRDFRVLWMGDAGFAIEDQLMAAEISFEAEILHVSHHGSKTASSAAFLAKAAPTISIISCGFQNRYGHPAPEVLQELQAVSQVKRTDYDATLHLRLGRKAALAGTMKENYLPEHYARIMGTEG